MSGPVNNGGPAFPVVGVPASIQGNGMTLRDYFAAAALKGLLADPNPFDVPEGSTMAKEYAITAYDYADAMLAAREETDRE